MSAPDFSPQTETWGMPMSRIQLDMLLTRYRAAAELAAGRRVLEIGCGHALGHELLDRDATFVVAGDIDPTNMSGARRRWPDAALVQFDATASPFRDGSFDVALAFEMTYYVPDLPGMWTEVHRLLRPGGTLLVVSTNAERPGFHHSPHARRYLVASEFHAELERAGFDTTVTARWPLSDSVAARALRSVSGVADRFGLVPRSLRARAALKRFVQGRLTPYSGLLELDRTAGATPPGGEVASGTRCEDHVVLYVTAVRR